MPIATTRRDTRAFTLTELIVVVLIIALLIGILLPALSGVRSAARKATTSVLANDVANASIAFQTDARRLPGYFSQTDMGDNLNAQGAGGGFTNSENVLLDLAGGIVEASSGNLPASDNSFVDVAPGNIAAADTVRVDNNLVGAGRGRASYLRLPPASEGDSALAVVPGQYGADADPAMKDRTDMVDIVDSFGSPLVIFTRNEIAAARPDARFASRSTADDTGPAGSQFYWAANAGYFQSAGFREGERSRETSQRWLTEDGNFGSILAEPFTATSADESDAPGNTANNLELSLAGILGSPSLPSAEASPIDGQYAAPAAARGGIVVISAGPDRLFFARRQDPGLDSGVAGANAKNIVTYGLFTNGQPDVSVNEVSEFDDIVVAGGG